MTDTLPDKPSELIREALRHLRLAETNPAYRIDMTVWHQPDPKTNVCRVCLAGAVIAGLGADPSTPKSPYGFDPRTTQKLCALNRFRTGRVRFGLNAMHIYANNRTPPDRAVASYEGHPDLFKTDMEYLADELEFAGL